MSRGVQTTCDDTVALTGEPAVLRAASCTGAVEPDRVMAPSASDRGTRSSRWLRADTLVESVAVLIVMAFAQRLVGLVRSVLVCRWLEPEQLGEWDLANRFFIFAVPLVVLGLPGTFGRYLEHFRQRGALRSVLIRTTAVCLALLAAAMAAMLAWPAMFAQQVFGTEERTRDIAIVACGLAAVVAYNYLAELLTALRRVRLSSVGHFINAVVFAALSIALLAWWKADGMAIVVAYAGACLVLVAAALVWLAISWRHLAADTSSVSAAEMWRKLAPFAVWVWTTNLLYNSFEVVLRYMVLHYGNLPDPQSLIGQYHTAQVIPALMISVAMLAAGIILPHLTRQWEAGERDEVGRTLNLAAKLLGLGMFAGSALVLPIAPMLFDVVWQGKYGGGLALLPLALVSCGWLALVTLAKMYLWCGERARLGCVALTIGLVVNVSLNLALIPQFGLSGALWGTTLANGVLFLVVMEMNRRLGLRPSGGIWLVAFLPLLLLLGPVVSLVGLLVAAGASWWGQIVFDKSEKDQLAGVWRRSLARMGLVRT